MMGRGYGYHHGDRGVMRSGMLGPPMMMRMIFSLMDADGDGKLSLQEFQAAHERIFKAIDVTKMASLPWKKCRISSAAPADQLPSSSLASRIQNKDRGQQRGASLAGSQWSTTSGPANDAGGRPRRMSAFGT